ncbi:MAG: biotin--[acetyl-CoA-carboxylase] ligase [Microbacterium sp.]|uniref:biotin--[biotin carboxyl-carrier protein] ligase n=1 Tax=Microbacterium ginsengisoli TaxID=400772 RepID=A0A0F0LVX5_9MICO|nr:biotin--[acetyl-CoA-carboxylase] ligase [Microbacterium ginsengisoli]KJL35586.1 Bifunctional ligase/repressor BirA [Microbacterium ginsengisoli]MAL06686.1 biotin--[acetyl-CoA-carboxylase] ligase [Microbacterium sp.]MBN9207995.1 biotin--[acetyl-CoA-carboxylase] ligase [Microbacterium ginsengisoli]HAN23125.1 biotin--[acetyl-CoA-carboxylase] ligase [Microbacterium ginsengisoli]
MPIPTAGFPLAAAVSPRLQVAEHTDSTNADLVAAVRDAPRDWPHLSALLTTDQRRGRGRLDRTWVAPPGAALALSVVVDVAGLPIAARGWIPLAAGAAMTRAVAAQLRGTGNSAGLKWPNDVLVDGLKICGILAEAVAGSPSTVVVGSGVNTRMAAVDLPVTTATSFAALGVAVDEDRLIADYLTALDEQLAALAAAGGDASAAGLRGEIESLCLTLGRAVTVSLPDGSALVGEAVRIDPDGRLVVRGAAGETAVAAGDVTHVR